MPTERDLRERLRRIDGRGYKAYKDIAGHYDFDAFTLAIDHVQGDPFAAPSKIRVRVPMAEAALPAALFESRARRTALADFLAREIRSAIQGRGARRTGSGSGRSGLIQIDAGGQEVLERTAVRVTPDHVEARMEVGLPAAGRRALGRQAETLLAEEVPAAALRGLLWSRLPRDEAERFVACVENQEHVRARLGEFGLVAFVGNGAVLPRESGASDRPLRGPDVVPFRSPPELERSIDVPNPVDATGERKLMGMAIPKGVTVIAGGGYHGKSTLLRALERGVYAHVPDDGRESVVSAPDLVKIRAEDGRSVEQTDIHAFVRALPGGRSTRAFTTDDASGSTSQAANIVEALEAGATGLLIDEDTSATNFMVRDARMQALVHRDGEPITPFLDRVRGLWEELGISTVLVMGSCGDYFEVADRVVTLREYVPSDATAAARDVVARIVSQRRPDPPDGLLPATPRAPLPESFDPQRGRREVKIDAKERDLILYGRDPIDLRAVEQLVDRSQTRAIGLAIHLAAQRFMDGGTPLAEVLDTLEAFLDREGLDALDPRRRGERHPGNLARPRRHEIAAAINRMRSLRVRQARVSERSS